MGDGRSYDLGDGLVGAVVVSPSRSRRGVRIGWTRLSRPGDKCATRWRHDASGWLVQHCGHPTANYPYTASLGELTLVTSESGRGFRRLVDVCEVVEGLLAGERRLDLGDRRTRIVPVASEAPPPST